VFDVQLIARYIQLVGSSKTASSEIYEYPLHAWVDVAGSRLELIDFAIAFWDVARIHRKYTRSVSSEDARA